MKCANCGHEQPYTCIQDGKRYRDAVEKRLEEYGYPAGMTPPKHQAATAVRKVIAIRYGISGKAGGSMLPEAADQAISGLDAVLPSKEVER